MEKSFYLWVGRKKGQAVFSPLCTFARSRGLKKTETERCLNVDWRSEVCFWWFLELEGFFNFRKGWTTMGSQSVSKCACFLISGKNFIIPFYHKPYLAFIVFAFIKKG